MITAKCLKILYPVVAFVFIIIHFVIVRTICATDASICVRNYGFAIVSINIPILFYCLAWGFALFVTIYAFRKDNVAQYISSGICIAGFGNILERVCYGYVHDYMRWFNISDNLNDIIITVYIVFLCVHLWRKK